MLWNLCAYSPPVWLSQFTQIFAIIPEVSRGLIFQQEQIARVVELGLGAASPERIDLITDDAESAAYAAQIRTILALG